MARTRGTLDVETTAGTSVSVGYFSESSPSYPNPRCGRGRRLGNRLEKDVVTVSDLLTDTVQYITVEGSVRLLQ